ncbi:MAG: hypothetical protein HQ513_14805 [Rhodospirillales bacterium]|nr:hypothetical protein [Rhodospirillales bacterium]
MTRIAWGKGKREVLLFKNEINDLFAQGATIEETYRILSDRLTVSKPTFRRHAAVLRRDALPDSAWTTPPPSHSLVVRKPKPASVPIDGKPDDNESLSTEATFAYDPAATDEDLW